MNKVGPILLIWLKLNKKIVFLKGPKNTERTNWKCWKSSEEEAILKITTSLWKRRERKKDITKITFMRKTLIWVKRLLMRVKAIKTLAQSATSSLDATRFSIHLSLHSFSSTLILLPMLLHLIESTTEECWSLSEMVMDWSVLVRANLWTMRPLSIKHSKSWEQTLFASTWRRVGLHQPTCKVLTTMSESRFSLSTLLTIGVTHCSGTCFCILASSTADLHARVVSVSLTVWCMHTSTVSLQTRHLPLSPRKEVQRCSRAPSITQPQWTQRLSIMLDEWLNHDNLGQRLSA